METKGNMENQQCQLIKNQQCQLLKKSAMPAAKNFEMQESTHLPDSDDESGGADKDEEALHI